MKSHPFKVVIEEDAFEDGPKAYHAYCPPCQVVIPGAIPRKRL